MFNLDESRFTLVYLSLCAAVCAPRARNSPVPYPMRRVKPCWVNPVVYFPHVPQSVRGAPGIRPCPTRDCA